MNLKDLVCLLGPARTIFESLNRHPASPIHFLPASEDPKKKNNSDPTQPIGISWYRTGSLGFPQVKHGRPMGGFRIASGDLTSGSFSHYGALSHWANGPHGCKAQL